MNNRVIHTGKSKWIRIRERKSRRKKKLVTHLTYEKTKTKTSNKKKICFDEQFHFLF